MISAISQHAPLALCKSHPKHPNPGLPGLQYRTNLDVCCADFRGAFGVSNFQHGGFDIFSIRISEVHDRKCDKVPFQRYRFLHVIIFSYHLPKKRRPDGSLHEWPYLIPPSHFSTRPCDLHVSWGCPQIGPQTHPNSNIPFDLRRNCTNPSNMSEKLCGFLRSFCYNWWEYKVEYQTSFPTRNYNSCVGWLFSQQPWPKAVATNATKYQNMLWLPANSSWIPTWAAETESISFSVTGRWVE